MKTRTKLIGFSAAVLAVGIGTYAFKARSEEAQWFGPPFMHRGMGGMMGPSMMHGGMTGLGVMGMAHDPATMAQLRVIHALFVDHERIKRTVTNLPNGIRTVTESHDPQITSLLKTHVSDMMKRVGAGDDPGLPIEMPGMRGMMGAPKRISASECHEHGERHRTQQVDLGQCRS
jgi:hypothetical protein